VREIKSVRFKRIHIALSGDGKAGHWWFELGPADWSNSESYGWWPECQVSRVRMFIGVKGLLNDGLNRQLPARDPHHGEIGDEEFHPLVGDDDLRTDDEIAACLREFARNYSGRWQWFFGWGQNCHTFQRAALRHCGLKVPVHARKAKL
jgi:hypothetical protein